MLYPHH